MKGRKNIFKIAITSVLSATMCLTGALAVKSVMPAKAFAETTVNTSSIVDNVVYSGTGAATDYGTYYDLEATSKSFTGLKLTGGTGAKFELGTIDLKKSYWNGVDMTYDKDAPFSGVTKTTDMQENVEGVVRDYNKFLYDTTTDSVYGKYYNGSDDFANFIAFAFAPHVNRFKKTPYDKASLNYNEKELKGFTITLTDVSNNGNYLTIKSTEQNDNNGEGGRSLGTSGNGQSVNAGMRKVGTDGPRLYDGLRVAMRDVGGADQVPYELCYSQNWDATSEADRNPALYSPNGSTAIASIAGTWLIRKFAKTTYANAGCVSDSAWNGFSSSKVKVTVTFDEVRTVSDKNDESKTNEGVTSLIITSLGGYDLTQAQQTLTDADYFDGAQYNAKNPSSVLKGDDTALYAPLKSSVITSSAVIGSKVEVYDRDNALESTVTFNNATETYAFKKTGTYTLKWYDAADSLIKTTTVQSVSAVVDVDKDIASKITSNTGSAAYIANKKQVSNSNVFSGVRLTGVTGSTFDLGEFKLDNNKMYWNGNVKDASYGTYTGTNDHDKAAHAEDTKSYGSIFSFVYDPAAAASVTGDLELDEMFITFTEVGNESNYVTFYVADDHAGSGAGDDNGIRIYAKGTKNDGKKADSTITFINERYRSTGTTLTEAARKQMNAYGNQTKPIDLVWDNEKAIAYSNISFESTIDGISGAWGLRQFKATKEDYVAGAKGQDEYVKRGYQPWDGFTNGATLNVRLNFRVFKRANLLL